MASDYNIQVGQIYQIVTGALVMVIGETERLPDEYYIIYLTDNEPYNKRGHKSIAYKETLIGSCERVEIEINILPRSQDIASRLQAVQATYPAPTPQESLKAWETDIEALEERVKRGSNDE